MNTSVQTEITQLRSADGQAATLKSVHIEGRLDGLMLVMKSRQSYRNDGTSNLEAVYTFPLPWGATLMALNAEIGGQRLIGTVMEKKQASARYEKAIDDGDTPVMVEQSAPCLYTANLGNLKPGEDAVVEIEHAQLLRFEQGQIRITVPTTVAPRYGDAHAAGGLAPHESVNASLLAEYPLTADILLTGDVARGAVHSPSHAIVTTARDDGTLVSLKRGGFLDRDLVLLIDGLQGASFATVVPDGDAFAVLASFCPDVKSQGRAPLRLKVLVDCSGSMGGDSIEAARSALHEVLKELEHADHISYSRFGSDVVHHLKAMQPCDVATIQAVASLVTQTDADLGGTEMNEALLSTFALDAGRDGGKSGPTSEALARHTDVLLVTDGEIWGVDDVLSSAQTSGHRIFAIGVGSSPTESLLRELAEKTGGACELVSPNQDIAGVILRMFRRLRAPRIAGVKVDWDQDVLWQSPAPEYLFGGDTVHTFARLQQNPARPPVLSWTGGEIRERACAAKVELGAGDTLARMCGAAQLASLSQHTVEPDVPTIHAERLALALHYQLVTDQTNLILVHVREEGQKAVGLPQLEQIAHMQAAGWGAAGLVKAAAMLTPPQRPVFSIKQSSAPEVNFREESSNLFASYESRAVWRDGTSASASMIDSSFDALDMAYEIPAFLRKQDRPTFQVGSTSPMELLQSLKASPLSIQGPLVWAAELDTLGVPQPLASIIEAMVLELGSREQAWGIVLHWLGQALAGEFTLARQAARLVRSSIKPVDAATLQRWTDALALALGPVQANAWGKVNETA